MNPMRALMQIPLREPPKLSDQSAWSSHFHDFLLQCLNREPRKRATIEQLLEHPFVQARDLALKKYFPNLEGFRLLGWPFYIAL